MPKRSSKGKAQDINELAASIVGEATDEWLSPSIDSEELPKEKNPAAVALGRLGGKKGGPARAAKLTPTQRREIARKAARTRWSGKQQ